MFLVVRVSWVASNYLLRHRLIVVKNTLIIIPARRDRLIKLARDLRIVVRPRRAPMVLLHVPPGRMAHRHVLVVQAAQAAQAARVVRVVFHAPAALLAPEALAAPVARPVRVDLVERVVPVVLVVRPDRE